MAESTEPTAEAEGTSTQAEEPSTEALAESLKDQFASTFGDGELDTSSRRSERGEAELDLDELDEDDLEEDERTDFDEEGDADADAEGDADTDGDKAPEGSEEAETEEGDQKPTLDPVRRRAVQRAGGDLEAVDKLFQSGAEGQKLAEQYADTCLNSLNSLSARFGQLGSGPSQPPAQQQQAQPPAQAPGSQARNAREPLMAQLYGENLEALKEKYGEDYFQDIVEPLIAPVQELMVEAQMRQNQMIGQEIGNFFESLDDEFAELYGKGPKASTEQMALREELAVLADRIRAGAERQGHPMSVVDALEQANLVVGAQHIGKLTRKKIAQELKHRSGQATHRPTHRRRRPESGERSEKSAMRAAADKLVELGLDPGGDDDLF